MQCEVAREALSARFDGEREHVPSSRVDEHVAGCADCAQFAQALQRFSQPPPVSGVAAPDFAARVLNAAASAPPQPQSWWTPSRLRWLYAAIAACLTGALVVAVVLCPWNWLSVPVLVVAVVATWLLTRRAGRADATGERPGRRTRG